LRINCSDNNALLFTAHRVRHRSTPTADAAAAAAAEVMPPQVMQIAAAARIAHLCQSPAVHKP